MQLGMYSIKDIKINEFISPISSKHNMEAIREFTTAVRNPQSNLFHYPEDFELWKLGHFDTEKGTFNEDKQCLTNGVQAKGEPQNA